MPLHAVLWDLDDTLFDYTGSDRAGVLLGCRRCAGRDTLALSTAKPKRYCHCEAHAYSPAVIASTLQGLRRSSVVVQEDTTGPT